MKTITGNLFAFATDRSAFNPGMIGSSPDDEVIETLSFAGESMLDYATWTRVGKVELTIAFDDTDTIVANKVDKLRDKKRNVQAEAEKIITEIDAQIQSLLAIEYKPCQTTEG